MTHPERKLAKRFDYPSRSAAFTDQVYAGTEGSGNRIQEEQQSRLPEAPRYNVYFGELHGHSNLSDGCPSVDEYFTALRDKAGIFS